MAQKVSTFLNVGGPPYRYAFVLVVWNEYAHAVRDELNRQAEAFGADLGPQGVFVQSFRERMYDTGAEVLAKPWPAEVRARLDDDPEPIILVLDHEFESFTPEEHPYAIIWLSDFRENPEAVRPLLIKLAQLTKRRDDVVLYLQEVAERASREAQVGDATRAVRALARMASYVELKPSVFGVSIDLKAILRDLAGR